MKKIFALLFIGFLFSYPNKNDFNELFIKVSQQGSPAVVSILSEKTEQYINPFFFDPFGNSDPFEPKERKSQGIGSGVVIDKQKGHILTNNHVVDGANEIKVILFDKREIKAEILGADPLSDLAVLKIDATNLEEANMGNSDNLEIGEWVIAIGSPFGLHLNHTVTCGIVSAKGRSDVISRANFENFIQHDAAINPGNSGGALFDLNGDLIGINTAIATDGFSKSNAGVGFAIPINQAKRVIEDLINGGQVLRGYLGVMIQDLDENKAKVLGLENNKGAFISMIVEDGPADNGGLREKDVIISLNSKPIESSNQLRNDVSSLRPGETAVFSIIRNELLQSISVVLGQRPDENFIGDSYKKQTKYDLLGLIIEDNDNNGVKIIDINSEGEAYSNNIRKNDIINEINRVEIKNSNDYYKEITNYSKGNVIMLRIVRNGNNLYEAFEIK
ncbi:MAG: protease [Candidatus Marinimicrobia bacterium]|nr:protease [Candidatus Neomarinimicrobiota bacterium]|tara:strand:+ start:6860 stop:8197 length:1338 start_codon:yes stop_codon:yes gene_type:complete